MDIIYYSISIAITIVASISLSVQLHTRFLHVVSQFAIFLFHFDSIWSFYEHFHIHMWMNTFIYISHERIILWRRLQCSQLLTVCWTNLVLLRLRCNRCSCRVVFVLSSCVLCCSLFWRKDARYTFVDVYSKYAVRFISTIIPVLTLYRPLYFPHTAPLSSCQSINNHYAPSVAQLIFFSVLLLYLATMYI